MNTNLIAGRQNLSVTVFVPSNCTNNCSFCKNKKDYSENKCNLEKVLKKIKKLGKTDFVWKYVDSFVLTGGEPFADLSILEQIIDAVPRNKKVYINTTVPTNRYSEKEIADFIDTHRVDGINISRHSNTFDKDKKMFHSIATDNFVSLVKVPVKINILATEDTNILDCIERWSKYKNTRISFRADYRTVTISNLRLLSDDFLDKIYQIPDVQYIGHGGCDVCFDVSFQYKHDFIFSYHKGLEHSSVHFGNNLLVNDLIIFQDGKVAYDWDREKRLQVKHGQILLKDDKEFNRNREV